MNEASVAVSRILAVTPGAQFIDVAPRGSGTLCEHANFSPSVVRLASTAVAGGDYLDSQAIEQVFNGRRLEVTGLAAARRWPRPISSER